MLLSSFTSVATVLLPFLTAYQTDKVMVPFLAGDLFLVLEKLMRRFMKADAIKGTTMATITSLDPDNKALHVGHSRIDIGFAAEKSMKSLLSGGKISEKQVLEVRLDCKKFVVALVKKLLEKSPLTHPLVRALQSLDPQEMASAKDHCEKKFKRVLTHLVNSSKIQVSACDEILSQFHTFLHTVIPKNHAEYVNFEPFSEDNRLDALLFRDMANNSQLCQLWTVVRDILLLSHGQASVERGFSVNRQLEVENLKEDSLVAQRLIHDHLRAVGGIANVELSKPLLASVASARQRYSMYLDDQRKERLQEDGMRKGRLSWMTLNSRRSAGVPL